MQGRSGALPVGSRLQGGKYVVEAVLGEGSFGITYRAANTGSRLHQQVAIKELFVEGSTRAEAGRVMHPPQRSDESWGRLTGNFEREAQTLARLKHPGIVTVYDCFEENDTLYIVMEFVDGTNLDRLVRQRGGHLPEAEALGYVAEVAAALTVLHANGVLHRDIKPANIMIDTSGHAVLIDFGTARDFVPDKTLTHSVTLTPAFAPPEQFQPRARRGPFTDIYALAATTYWLLTGDLLDMWDTSKVNEDERLSPRLRAALTHALTFNPADRTPDAATFSRELLGTTTLPQPASPPLPDPSATATASGYERNAVADPGATTIPNRNPPPPAPAWSAETYDESRGNPPPFTASELASRQLDADSAPPRRSLWLALSGGVAAAALLAVLAILLLGGNKGNGTNTTGGGASDTPTIAAQVVATDIVAPPTETLVPVALTPLPSMPSFIEFKGVNMLSANEGLAVGSKCERGGPGMVGCDGGYILKYTHNQWGIVCSHSSALNGIYMVSQDEGWAVGDVGADIIGRTFTPHRGGDILHYKNGTCDEVSNPGGNDLTSVSMISADEGWAVGGGDILHYSNGAWEKISSPDGENWRQVIMTSANDGWITGNTLLHYTNGKWIQATGPDFASQEGGYLIGATPDKSVWLLYVYEKPISPVPVGSDTPIRQFGLMLNYDEQGWHEITAPLDVDLSNVNSLNVVSVDEIWGVGYSLVVGGSICLDPTPVYTPTPSATAQPYECMEGTSDPSKTAIKPIFLHYTGGQWQDLSNLTNQPLHLIYMVSSNEGWAFDEGIILHYQNGVWSEYKQL